jgi:tetratricopeptide (TPR) repeat protein
LPAVYLVPVQRSVTTVSSLIPGRVQARLRVDLGTEQAMELLPVLEEAKPGQKESSIYRAGEKPEPDHRKAAMAAMEKGQTAYQAGRFEEAQQQYLTAIGLYEKSLAHLEDGDALATAFGYLGLTMLRLGKTALGRDAIESAYSLNPALKLEKLPLPARVRNQVIAAGRRALNRRKGTIEINVDPPGAWVFVDGDEKGKAPLVHQGVLPGRHYVSARMKGRLARSVVVEVKTGATVKVDLTLPDRAPQFATGAGLAHAFQAEVVKRIQGGLVDRQVKPVATQLASRLRADYLVLGGLDRSEQGGYLLRTWIFRARDQKLVELDSFALDGELLNLSTGTRKAADAVAAAVASFPEARDINFVAKPRLRPGAGAGPSDLVGVTPGGGPTEVHSTRKPWYLRWSFWGTVIGIVVAGGAAGAGYGIYMVTNRESAGYRVSVEVP